MEELKINAVQCSKCGTNNPRFYIKCKNCSRKLDMSDKRVYDENVDEKTANATKWTTTSLAVFTIVFGTLFYLVIKFLGINNHNSSSSQPQLNRSNIGTYGTLTKFDFINKVKENQVVVDADITDVNYLYIAVINDNSNKDAMAAFYCRLAKEYNVSEVKAVKVIDVANAYLPKNGTASGKELGKAFCD